jgi:hypothetical protein
MVDTAIAKIYRLKKSGIWDRLYLFAHMTKEDYGRLYYSVSTDGRRWTLLNGGRRVMGDDYLGHPEIARGPDGTYWLVGVRPRENPGVIFWQSRDLIAWTRGPGIDGPCFDVGERKGGPPISARPSCSTTPQPGSITSPGTPPAAISRPMSSTASTKPAGPTCAPSS